MELDIDKLKAKTEKIAKKYNLQLVILYGSFAKNLARQTSDIDIAVLGKQKISFEEEIGLNGEFMSVAAKLRVKDVDVKSLHNASPFFRYQVMKDGILLYGDIHQFNTFKLYAIRFFQETGKFRNLRDLMLKKRMSHLKELYVR